MDDERTLRKFLVAVLRKEGYEVLEAGSAEDALIVCENHAGTIHLVVTDVVMPGKSGPELTSCLKSRPDHPLVLYISGFPDGILAEKGLEPGAAFLAKPFTPSELVATIAGVLVARGAPSAATTPTST